MTKPGWMIEKDGTGIEKSGTGIKRLGNGNAGSDQGWFSETGRARP